MNKKKIFATALSAAMLVSSISSVFAAAPADYDGNSYAALGYESTDPDGQFNLAVIARNDIQIVGNAQYIRGSLYANGDIYVSNGSGNKIEGLFISGTESSFDSGEGTTDDYIAEGYIHVTDELTREGINAYSTKPEYAGGVKDDATSFDYSYSAYEVPEIANNAGDVAVNEWGSAGANNAPQTISEDTHYDSLYVYGNSFTIDTTNGDVTVVIDRLKLGHSPVIKVAGENKANIYVKSFVDDEKGEGVFECTVAQADADIYNYKAWSSTGWKDQTAGDQDALDYLAGLGKPSNVNLYIDSDSGVKFNNAKVAANVFSNSDSFSVAGSSKTVGNISTAASEFEITGGGTLVEGTVFAPNAVSGVYGSGTLYGQLYTDSLVNKGEGRIIWKADEAVTKVQATEAPAETAEPTAAPTEAPAETAEPTETPAAEEPTPAPTKDVVLPKGPAKDYTDFKYAYIFGYEPYDDEQGIVLNMAPEDKVTREQVCAMLTRIDDQYNNKIGKSRSLPDGIFNENATPDRWSYNALSAVAATNAFWGMEDLDPAVPVSRGEVARIVAFMLGINDYDENISFSDVAGDDNEVYIKIVATAGYIRGRGDGTFDPSAAITRAEICSIINKIIGRTSENGYVLETADGTPVTAETYHFSDLSKSAWYYETMLLATSAFDGNYVDLGTRSSNIRNVLDNFDAQYDY